jgi:hypothetical protein
MRCVRICPVGADARIFSVASISDMKKLIERLEKLRRCHCGNAIGHPSVPSCTCDLAAIDEAIRLLSDHESAKTVGVTVIGEPGKWVTDLVGGDSSKISFQVKSR